MFQSPFARSPGKSDENQNYAPDRDSAFGTKNQKLNEKKIFFFLKNFQKLHSNFQNFSDFSNFTFNSFH